jgi:NitT/TauT family transport system substrate-binding protein
MRLRLYENHRFALYAPFYVAHAIGAYSAEGLAVELLLSPGMGLAEQALLDGSVDVLWAGPMRVMRHHDQNPSSRLGGVVNYFDVARNASPCWEEA